MDEQAEEVGRRPAHTGVPGFFRTCCYEASMGGNNGYAAAGWHLGIHTGEQQPYDAEDDEWEQMIGELTNALDADDDAAVWRWYATTFPKCAALVPSRRRSRFVSGVKQAYEDGRLFF